MSGRMWAIDIPEVVDKATPLAKAYALGRWPIYISSFGRNHSGEIYLSDYVKGTVYRLGITSSP